MEPQDRVKPVKPLQSSSPSKQYLIIYNFVSSMLWLVVLGRVLLLVPLVGIENVYGGVGEFSKWTQTGALLEVVHAMVGEFVWVLSSIFIDYAQLIIFPTFPPILHLQFQVNELDIDQLLIT